MRLAWRNAEELEQVPLVRRRESAGAEKECDGKEPHGKTTGISSAPFP